MPPAPTVVASTKKGKKKKKSKKGQKRKLEDTDSTAAPSPAKKQKLNDSTAAPVRSEEDVTMEDTPTPEPVKKPQTPKPDDGVDRAWSSLDVCENTMKAIRDLGFDEMMDIQAKAIPVLLEGKDVAGAARTGSGKTLAFVVPLVEALAREEWTKQRGTGGIIIAPTRELAIQIKGVCQQIARYHRGIRVGMTIGGSYRQAECQMLKAGCGIIVATPGRLMDHLERTTFKFDDLKYIIIDEADQILDIGFEHQMHTILKALPYEDRQTALFSATLTEKTKDLVTMAFRSKPVFVRGGKALAPDGEKLEQMYVVLQQDQKLAALLTWMRRHKDKKILVFFSTKKGVMFYERLFRSIGIRCLALYGAMQQDRRTQTFFDFVEAKSGILLATNVASRGLDFPKVHWIIQFDPPIEPKEYIHRIGRAARAHETGKALVWLQPTELDYLSLLEDCNLSLKKIEIEDVDYTGLQSKLESVVSQNQDLHWLAQQGCLAFARSYDQRANSVFNNAGINRNHAAKSFCLDEYPSYQRRDDVVDVFGDGDGGGQFGGGGFRRGRGRGGFGGRGRGFGRGRGRGGFRGGRGGGFRGRGRGGFRNNNRGRGRGFRRGGRGRDW